MIQRAVILAALLFFPTAAHATGPACCGGGGSSISANSCSVPGDFATGIAADGTLTCSTPSGGGNVSNTGTPVDNQLAIWTAATTIEGDSALTFDTSTNTLTTTTFSGALSGNATTATALASNPSDCASDTYATTIAASGNLTCASITNASTTGTATNTPSTLVLRDGSGNFAAGTITAALTGNASTATALAANPADCGADTYATTIAASGALTCSTVTNAGLAGSIAVSKTLATGGAGIDINTNDFVTDSSETSFLANSTSLPGTCGEGAVYQDTDSGGTETYVCTAANTWTKTIAATDNVATATALASNPSDCGADTYATTIAASGNLTCSTVSSAGIADGAIVNADINASAAISVSKTALSAGFGLDLSGNSLSVNGAEWTGPQVWGDGSGTMSWTFNAGITDPIIDFYATGVVDVTGTLQMNTVPVVTETGTQTLTNKTLTTPTIASFTNATHSHQNAAGGGTLDHGAALTGLSDDDHTQYTLRAGRASTGNDTIISTNGAGTIYGSGTTANDLTLRANDDDTTTGEINLNAPRIDIYPSYPASTSSDFTLIRSAPTTTLTGGTADYIMVEAAPAITVADTTSSQYFRAAGSVDRTGTSGGTLYQVTGFHNAPTLTSSTTAGPLFQDAFFDASVVNQVANTGTQNTYQPISFLSKPTFKASSGATLTIGQTTGVDINPSWGVAAGGTLTNTTFSAFKLHAPNEIGGTLSLPNYIALDVEDLDTAGVTAPMSVRSVGTTTEMRHAGPAIFGATGAPTSGKKLDVQGDTLITGALDVGDSVADPTGSTTTKVVDINDTINTPNPNGNLTGYGFYPTSAQSESNNIVAVDIQPTINQSGSSKVPTFYGVNIAGTTTATTANFPAAALMRHARTYTSATASATPVTSLITITNSPTVSNTATSGTTTVTAVMGMLHNPTFTLNDTNGATGGNTTMTVTDDIGLSMTGTYTETAGVLAVTNRTGLKFADVTNTSSATAITNNVGVDIAALSTATTNIGIRNADTTVYTPATSTMSAASSTISAGQTVTELNNTSGGALTITAAPTIADGVNGQILYVFNGSANNVVIQDQGTLASSNLRLSATTITLGTRDSITLMYSSTVGDWIQIGQVNVL